MNVLIINFHYIWQQKKPYHYANKKSFILYIFKNDVGQKALFYIRLGFYIFFRVSFIISLSLSGSDDGYDYDLILEKGTEMQAHITYVESINNIEVNGENPIRIIYTYNDNGKEVTDEFKTLDLYEADLMIESETAPVKVFNEQSAIVGLDPFNFPYFIFLVFPILFFIGGITMLFIAAKPALNNYRLYKSGIVKEAQIYAIMPVSGLPVTNIGRKVSVDYTYTGKSGNKLYGNTISKDFTLLAKFKAGDIVKVFVSETDETKSTLIPEDLARKNNWNI